MRCLSAIAVFLLVAALPLTAQRGGGGHVSGGSHGGFSGHGGGFSGGHSFGGFHSGSSFAPRSFSRGFSRGPIASRGFNRNFNRGFSNRGFNRGGTNFRIRSYGFRNNCLGYNCGYGYGSPYLWGGIDPYWWWDNGSDNGYDPSAPYNYDDGMANQMYQQGIPMRPPPEPDDQNSSAHSAPPQQQQAERTELATPTVLVFRDQHREEVQNYAIVGETLWTFAPQKTRKISLDDIDIPATQKANDERGLDFRVPGA